MKVSRFLATVSVAATCIALSAVNSFAITSQFRGVNWADKRDNFVSDVLVLSGLSLSDNYQSASVAAERIIGQFQELLGTNSVRMPVNEPTILNAFDMYSGALDVALKHGRLVMGYWGPSQPSGPSNMENWWKMWAKLVEKYGEHPNAYFEIMNEPHMYNKDQLRNLYAEWIQKFPKVPRDHIILDGSGMAQNVPDIADDSRFEGCLFAVHEYTFWNMSITTEQGWRNSFKGKVGKYADRTVCTEWGGAMAPGDKAGVHYETMDYNSAPTNYFMAYIRGMSDQLREWEMGSFYWPGLRDGDWYSMTKRSGEGANIKLEVVNQSGLDRMHMAWADTVAVVVVDTIPADTAVVDSTVGDTTVADSNAVATDSLVSIASGMRGISGEEFARPSGYKVFGMTGKFLGNVELQALGARDMANGLRRAGFAKGVYMVRGTSGAMRVQVR